MTPESYVLSAFNGKSHLTINEAIALVTPLMTDTPTDDTARLRRELAAVTLLYREALDCLACEQQRPGETFEDCKARVAARLVKP